MSRRTGRTEMDDYFASITGAYFKAQGSDLLDAQGFVGDDGGIDKTVPLIVAAHLAWNPDDISPLTRAMNAQTQLQQLD